MEESKVTMAQNTHRNRVRRLRSDFVFDCVMYGLAVLLVIVALYPMYFIVIASISDPNLVARGDILLLPRGITLAGYRHLLSMGNLWTGYGNTILYTLVGTMIMLGVNIPVAYVLSRKDLVGRRLFTLFFIFPMFFGGGLIPTYLLVNSLGMVNTFWALLIPGAMSVYNMIITRTFFQNGVPHELLEASQIDGCSDARYFFSILLPLSQAVISVISLYYAVAHWNSYFSALIYIRDKQLQPLQLILRSILLSTRVSLNEFEDPDLLEGKIGLEFLVKFALIVVSSAPIMCLYPFVQKFFAKGVMLGSVKG